MTPPLSADADKGDQDTLVFAYGFDPQGGGKQTTLGFLPELVGALDSSKEKAVAFAQNTRDEVRLVGGDGSIVGALAVETGSKRQCYVAVNAARWAVRRLTPVECERLQGFPDNWTAIPRKGKPASECPDGPRYRALGNSMAVPVMRWIGARLLAAMPEKKS